MRLVVRLRQFGKAIAIRKTDHCTVHPHQAGQPRRGRAALVGDYFAADCFTNIALTAALSSSMPYFLNRSSRTFLAPSCRQ